MKKKYVTGKYKHLPPAKQKLKLTKWLKKYPTIVEALKKHATLGQICKSFGIDEQTGKGIILAQQRLDTVSFDVQDDKLRFKYPDIMQHLSEGLTLQQIEQETGCTQPTIRNVKKHIDLYNSDKRPKDVLKYHELTLYTQLYIPKKDIPIYIDTNKFITKWSNKCPKLIEDLNKGMTSKDAYAKYKGNIGLNNVKKLNVIIRQNSKIEIKNKEKALEVDLERGLSDNEKAHYYIQTLDIPDKYFAMTFYNDSKPDIAEWFEDMYNVEGTDLNDISDDDLNWLLGRTWPMGCKSDDEFYEICDSHEYSKLMGRLADDPDPFGDDYSYNASRPINADVKNAKLQVEDDPYTPQTWAFEEWKKYVIAERRVAVWVEQCFHDTIALDKETYFVEGKKSIALKREKIIQAIINIFKSSFKNYQWSALQLVEKITKEYVDEFLFDNTINLLSGDQDLINEWDEGILTKNHFAILNEGYKCFYLEYYRALAIISEAKKEYDEWNRCFKKEPQHLKSFLSNGGHKLFHDELKERMLTSEEFQNNECSLLNNTRPIDSSIIDSIKGFDRSIKYLLEKFTESHPNFVIIEKKQLSEAALKRQQKREERKKNIKDMQSKAISKVQHRNKALKDAYDNGISLGPQEIEATIEEVNMRNEAYKELQEIYAKERRIKREQEDLERKKEEEQRERENKALKENDEYRNGKIKYDKLELELKNSDKFSILKEIAIKLVGANVWIFSSKWDADNEDSSQMKKLIPEAFTHDFQELLRLLKIVSFMDTCCLNKGVKEELRNYIQSIIDNDAQQKYNIEELKVIIPQLLKFLENPYYFEILKHEEDMRYERYEDIAKQVGAQAAKQWKLNNPYTSL
mgnify:CR=1 FL=1|tara:strand:- start:268332 stop:270902 length:2571 start_codon:yes stop_codon:yes gene_type:complete